MLILLFLTRKAIDICYLLNDKYKKLKNSSLYSDVNFYDSSTLTPGIQGS